jgi:hypothetical protein
MDSDEKTSENAVQKSKKPQQQHHDKQWTNPIEFLMTCIGFAVIIFIPDYMEFFFGHHHSHLN